MLNDQKAQKRQRKIIIIVSYSTDTERIKTDVPMLFAREVGPMVGRGMRSLTRSAISSTTRTFRHSSLTSNPSLPIYKHCYRLSYLLSYLVPTPEVDFS